MNKEIYKLLIKIKEKPGVFFGKKSLNKLVDCVYGYVFCMYERDKIHPEFLPYFQEFIEKEYNLNKNIYVFRHWSDIILFVTPTEEEAFDEFYKMVERYLKLDKKQLEGLNTKNIKEKFDVE